MGQVDAIGIANQRTTTVLWDRATGEPVGPAISWQDLRTVGTCLILREQGVCLDAERVRDEARIPARHLRPRAFERPLLRDDGHLGGLDSLSGALHVTDATNAAVTGLRTLDGRGWDQKVIGALNIPETVLPQVVDSSGAIGEASALEGSPPICGILGDQQASLVGQGCTLPGLDKDHLRDRRIPRLAASGRAAGVRPPWCRRHLPDRRLATPWHGDLGHRSRDALCRILHRLATRRPPA